MLESAFELPVGPGGVFSRTFGAGVWLGKLQALSKEPIVKAAPLFARIRARSKVYFERIVALALIVWKALELAAETDDLGAFEVLSMF